MTSALVQLQHWPATPWVRIVLIQNRIGQLVGSTGDSSSLTNRIDRDHLIALRNSAELVIAGAGTIRIENPPAPAVQYWIPSNSNQLPLNARAFSSNNTFLVSSIQHASLPTLMLPEISPAGLISLAAKRGLKRVLIEGGANLIRQFISAKLIDQALITVVDQVGGGEILHRAQFGLSLNQQINIDGLQFQSWIKEQQR